MERINPRPSWLLQLGIYPGGSIWEGVLDYYKIRRSKKYIH